MAFAQSVIIMSIQDDLFALKDEKYAAFQARINPTVSPDTIIGVRLPELRKLAKQYRKSGEDIAFLHSLPHRHFDENMLHTILIDGMKDYDTAISEIDSYLPYVDNWASCDSMSPKVLSKNLDVTFKKAVEWLKSEHEFTCRYGVLTLMNCFLDDAFRPEILQTVASVDRDEYYVKMIVAWFFATALAKQWVAVLPYLENRVLPDWIHRKAIQKAIESFRITDEQKQYLRSLK